MDHANRIVVSLAFALFASAALVHGCQNSGGKVLGPSGITKAELSPRCGVPCDSLDDCRKIRPKRSAGGTLAEFPFVWLECRDGLCVDVECVKDADCAEHVAPYEERVGRACVENQCAPPCGPTGECNDRYDSVYRRMQCVDGVCLMGEETPDPGCSGEGCSCFSDDECPSWTECRANNTCTGRLAYNSSRASGKPCSSDGQCGRLYMQQAMLERGLNAALLSFWGICSQMCGGSGEYACGDGFACVWVNSLVDLGKYPMELNEWNENRKVRSTCLPLSCDACGNSLKECVGDEGCPEGEACVTTWGGCPGVCLDAACEGCATWLGTRSNRECIPSAVDIPISVRRPD